MKVRAMPGHSSGSRRRKAARVSASKIMYSRREIFPPPSRGTRIWVTSMRSTFMMSIARALRSSAGNSESMRVMVSGTPIVWIVE